MFFQLFVKELLRNVPIEKFEEIPNGIPGGISEAFS